MRISHRTRLTLTTSGVCGVILAALFALALYVFRSSEEVRFHDVLRPPISQAKAIAEKSSAAPDLAEIADSYPQLSFAVFDSKGHVLASEGTLPLKQAYPWA